MLKLCIKEGTSELLIWKQLIMAEKMRESHRQLSEFQCYHKYLMAYAVTSQRRGGISVVHVFFKLRDCNDHFLTEPIIVPNQTHFHNLKFESHYFRSICSHRNKGKDTTKPTPLNTLQTIIYHCLLFSTDVCISTMLVCCCASIARWIWTSH